jgi:uncharacterized protein
MRVVLDTNIFVSALITETGSPNKIFDAWLNGRFGLVSSHEQMVELRRISRYPKLVKRVPKHVFGELINALGKTVLVEAASVVIELSDSDDAFLLGMAQTGHADYLVTGDKRAGLLALKNYGRTQIVTPTYFVGNVLK